MSEKDLDKENSASDDAVEHYAYSDPYRTKDMIWDAYFGFVNHYNDYRLFKNMNRAPKVNMSGLVKYACYFYEEVRGFLEKIYPKGADDIDKLDVIFDRVKVAFSHDEIVFLRRYFSSFMIDSGIKNIVYVKDNRDPVSKLKDNRYQDLNGNK